MTKNLKPIGSYNDSAREINKDAARDFALKIKLEGDLNKKLSQYFYKVDKQLTKAYELNGNILPSSLFKEELKNILAEHYRTVSKHFSSKLRMKAKSYEQYEYKALFCENKAVDHDISSQLLSYISKHSIQQSNIISDTNQKEFGLSIDKVKKEAAINGVIISTSQIAKEASILFKAKYIPRINLISITETQNIAEKSKLIEAESLNRVVTSNAKRFTKEVNPNQITKQWVTVLDERTRPAHVAADSQVQFLRVPFIVGGEKMMSPGDPSLGASAGNTINCLHPESIVNFATPDKLMRRNYQGLMVTIKTSSGNKLTITPNHPILTERGWILAKDLTIHDSVISCGYGQRKGFSNFNIKKVNTTIEQVYNSIVVDFAASNMGGSTVDVNFHGEIFKENVDIIFSNSLLKTRFKSFFSDPIKKLNLPHPDLCQGKLLAQSLTHQPFLRCGHFFSGVIGFSNVVKSLFKSHVLRSDDVAFATSSGFNVCKIKNSSNLTSGNSKLFSDLIFSHRFIEQGNNFFNAFRRNISNFFNCNGFKSIFNKVLPNSDLINLKKFSNFANTKSVLMKRDYLSRDFFADRIDHIDTQDYVGYVYNLEDEKEYYIANGIVNHNCRCSASYIMPDSPDAPYIDEFTQVNADARNLVANWTDDNGNEWGFIRGYATTFNQTNAEGIRFSKEEFDYAVELLKREKTEYIPMYLNHDKSRLVGWYKVDDLINTRNGLYAEGYINLSSDAGKEAAQGVRLGLYRYYSVRGYRDTDRGIFKLDEISIVDVPGMDEAVLMPVDVTRRSNIVRNPRNAAKPEIQPQDLNPDIGELGRFIGVDNSDFEDWFK